MGAWLQRLQKYFPKELGNPEEKDLLKQGKARVYRDGVVVLHCQQADTARKVLANLHLSTHEYALYRKPDAQGIRVNLDEQITDVSQEYHVSKLFSLSRSATVPNFKSYA